jgi:hypothetical protein
VKESLGIGSQFGSLDALRLACKPKRNNRDK